MSIDPEIQKTIFGAINTLEVFLKTDYTTKELYKHIGLQLHLMRVLNFENSPTLFDYIEEASFEELYSAQNLVSDYFIWLFSPWDSQFIADILKKAIDIDPLMFDELETAALAHRLLHMKSPHNWWFNTFDAVLCFHVGHKADFVLSKMATEQSSDADKITYSYGHFETLLHMSLLGLPESGTKDQEFLNLFERAKHQKRIPVTRYEYSDEDFDFLKVHEAVGNLNPKDALKKLCDGTLFKHTRIRSYDRMKDSIMKQKTAKRGGRSPKEIGEKIRQLRLDKNMTVEELAEASGKTIEFINKLEDGNVKKVYETSPQFFQ